VAPFRRGCVGGVQLRLQVIALGFGGFGTS
jgi:hypothetical protein